MGSALSAQCLEALLARKGQCALMANILMRTHRMLEAARAGDWDVVTVSEKKRSQLLRDCFVTPIDPANSELFSEALAAMLHMNEELVALVQKAKEQVSLNHNTDQRGIKAVSHYLDVSAELAGDE